jgi:PII-like signaling protein
MSSDLPIVVELIDAAEKIRPFVAVLRDMLDDGMMTIETIAIIYQDPGTKRS